MRYRLIVFIFILPFITNAQERDTTWTRGGNVSLFLQQVGVKNWAGGGQNSLSYGSNLTLFGNHIDKKHTWENRFEAGYGVIKKENLESRKNVDFFILQSNYGQYISDQWQVSGLIDFRSQFAPGYLYRLDAVTNEETEVLISDFMAPGYLQATIGMTYRPNESFNVTFSPLANKFIFVLHDSLSNAGAYGVEPGETMEHQIGASIMASLEKRVMENVILKTNLLLFADYSQITHIDVFWDLFLDMKINNWLTANLSVQTIYDHEIQIEDEDGGVGPRTQIRNILNVGIGYRFGDPLKEKD